MFICSANLESPECSPGIEATPSESVSKSCPEVHGGVDFRRGTSSSRKIGIVMGHKSERDSYGSGIFWWGNQLVRSSSPNGSFMVVDWPHFPWYPIKAQKKGRTLASTDWSVLCAFMFSLFFHVFSRNFLVNSSYPSWGFPQTHQADPFGEWQEERGEGQ